MSYQRPWWAFAQKKPATTRTQRSNVGMKVDGVLSGRPDDVLAPVVPPGLDVGYLHAVGDGPEGESERERGVKTVRGLLYTLQDGLRVQRDFRSQKKRVLCFMFKFGKPKMVNALEGSNQFIFYDFFGRKRQMATIYKQSLHLYVEIKTLFRQ